MASLKIREARASDADKLAPSLREVDREELEAAEGRGCDIGHILRTAVRISDMCWAAEEEDGEVIALFGVAGASLLGEHGPVGSPWLLGSDKLDRHAKTLVRAGKKYVGLIHEKYPYLANYVDKRNTISKRWLRRLGFTIHPPIPRGPMGMMFHRFDKLQAQDV